MIVCCVWPGWLDLFAWVSCLVGWLFVRIGRVVGCVGLVGWLVLVSAATACGHLRVTRAHKQAASKHKRLTWLVAWCGWLVGLVRIICVGWLVGWCWFGLVGWLVVSVAWFGGLLWLCWAGLGWVGLLVVCWVVGWLVAVVEVL